VQGLNQYLFTKLIILLKNINVKVILIGYPGSRCIVPASKYLASKYLPEWFDCFYLNHVGSVREWSNYICNFLLYLEDKYIIFSLDDYLISNKINEIDFVNAWDEMHEDSVVCVKLCYSTEQEHEEYPVTTQYCIWNREFLIWLLAQVSNPWEFEIHGSMIFRASGKKVIHRPCLEYFTNSSISSRWEGVRLDGLKKEDIDFIKKNNLIHE